MSTQLLELEGIGEWAKVFEVNRDNGDFHKDYNGACTIDLVMDKEEFDKVAAAGARLSGKPHDQGVMVKFKRKFEDPNVEAFGGAPKVADAEGNLWDLDEKGLIGNGSKVKVFVTIYDSKFGKGTRLEGVQVLEHVEYESDKEYSGVKLPF